jgi:nucleoside-diphosphate-sugar epimerase
MRVLLTGNRGKVGRHVEALLRSQGDEVVGFDIADGHDMLDKQALDRLIAGCRAVVHLAIVNLPDDRHPTRVLVDNVQGTWNVLLAAADAGIKRFVFMSSVNALGMFRGLGPPDYLPIDDDHPARPRAPYGLSKLLNDESCRFFSTRHGMTTVCLRPPAVWEPADYVRMLQRWRTNRRSEWSPAWEYGAFLDARDLADAVSRALRVPLQGHARLLLCSSDIASLDKTAPELARQLLPKVEWRGGDAYGTEPRRALVDTRRAREVLGWTPFYTWQRFIESEEGKAASTTALPAPSLRTRLWWLRQRLRLAR